MAKYQDHATYLQISRLLKSCFVLAIVAAITVMLAGPGSRFGIWGFRTGITILRWGAYGAIATLVISLIGLVLARSGISRRDLITAGLGFLISLIILGVVGRWYWTARHVPAIHDITTDTENPPGFVSILPLRKDALNPSAYGGQEIAAKQRTGYPDLGPAILNASTDQAFKRALSSAREMCWEIVASDPATGRIEATDTTFWFGFKDDIVVRISQTDGSSRIDVRSVSRVGLSDVGTNAKRIKRYLKRFKT